MNWWKFGYNRKMNDEPINATHEMLTKLDSQIEQLNNDEYLYYHPSPLRVLSVFDHLKYDRSDLDILSFRMRRHVIAALRNFGCIQKSGHIILQPDTGVRFIMPKFVALGASPFAATRYHHRNDNDYWVFTPTQAACFMIENLPFEEALSQIEDLLHRQPINLYRILDFLERKATHQPYHKAIGHLDKLQKKAVAREPLLSMRVL